MNNIYDTLITYLMKKYSEKYGDKFITTKQFVDMLCFFIEEAEVMNFVSEITKDLEN